ncbi:hypothetical protein AAVH_12930 [Aphelenchoides avenae]|nr:hypothetical protein AAVH_12930 [Aphelenchus avenae]
MRRRSSFRNVTDDYTVIGLTNVSSPKVNMKFFASRGEVRVTVDRKETWCNDIKQLESWPFGETKRRYRPIFLAGFLGNDCGIDIEVVGS